MKLNTAWLRVLCFIVVLLWLWVWQLFILDPMTFFELFLFALGMVVGITIERLMRNWEAFEDEKRRG